MNNAQKLFLRSLILEQVEELFSSAEDGDESKTRIEKTSVDDQIDSFILKFEKDSIKSDQNKSMSMNESLSDLKYRKAHFKNIHIHHLDALSLDLRHHSLVPKHEVIRDKGTIDQILEECNAKLSQLPVILRTDPQAKLLRMAPGDICKIHRVTATGGEVPYYRVCK